MVRETTLQSRRPGRGNHSPIWGEEVFPWEVTTEAEQKEVTKVTRAGKETFR